MRKVRLTKAIATASLSIVALLGTSACGENGASQEATSVVDSVSSTDSSKGDVVATTLIGDTFSLQEALKEKPVVLWFWAPG